MKFLPLTKVAFLVASLACKEAENTKPAPIIISPPKAWDLPQAATCGYQYTAQDAQGWTLALDENFDTNLDKWNIWLGGAYNNEKQNYKAENLILKNGYLYIHGKRETTTGRRNPQDNTQKTFYFSSGRIETKELFTATETESIKMVARIQQPAAVGNWSAFWSYGDPWPTRGEIDIMEYLGHEPTKFQSVYHYGSNPNQLQTNANINNFYYQTPAGTPNLASCFYVYECEWYAGQLDIKLDGKLLKSYTTSKHAFVEEFVNKPQRVVVNLAIGGDFFASLDENQIPNNSAMIVDWIKVYKKKK
jgi:beta-glucanase (GH16 family)